MRGDPQTFPKHRISYCPPKAARSSSRPPLPKMEDSLETCLLAISISDSEDSAADPKAQVSGSDAREARKAQSEEAWRTIKQTYKVKVENGDVSNFRPPARPRTGWEEPGLLP